MATYECTEPDCVGGSVDIWEDGTVPKCWGFAGDDPHPMTQKNADPFYDIGNESWVCGNCLMYTDQCECYDPWEDYSNPLHPYRSRDLDRL